VIFQNYLIIFVVGVGLVLFICFCGWMADRQDRRRADAELQLGRAIDRAEGDGFDIVKHHESDGGDPFYLLRSLPHRGEPQVVLALRAEEVDELRELLAAGQPSGPLVAELEAAHREVRELRGRLVDQRE
jgi:hypothetical protein